VPLQRYFSLPGVASLHTAVSSYPSYSCDQSFVAQSWGVLMYEHLHVLNILTKGSLRDTLANREWRLVLALMVRESYKVLLRV
jgi:hypothetical protein